MLSTIEDRTTEIGLRKALGASERSVMLQFLLESIIVCVLGGSAGALIGQLSIVLLEGYLNLYVAFGTKVITCLLSVIIGIALGVVSGLYPARQAGRMDPVKAMQFE